MATPDVELHVSSVVDRERRHAEEVERLRLLVEASATLLGSLRPDEVLPRVLDLARRTLAADAYGLWSRDEDTDTWDLATYDGLSASYVQAATDAIRGTPSVAYEGPVIAEDLATADWIGPEHREAHLAEGNRALLAVFLRHSEQVLGTLAFYYRQPHRFSESEVTAATTLANLAAAAMRSAELYARQTAMAEERHLLAETSEILSSSLDYETTLANVARAVVPDFADWCAIDVADPEHGVRRLATAHVDPEKVALAETLGEKYPPDPDAPYGVANVLRTGQSELIPHVSDELLRAATIDKPELFDIVRALGLRSSLCVPMVVRNRVLGAITFIGAESGRIYSESDIVIAEDLARRAATAIDNALLFRRSEEARHVAEAAQERLSVLAEASQSLASTLDHEATLANIARLIVPRYADWYAVDVIDDDGTFRRIAVVHRDPAKAPWAEKSQHTYGADADEPEGTGRVVRTGKPVLYETITDELLAASTRDAEHHEVLRQLGMESAMVVPLTAGGRTFGALMLVSSDPDHRYGQDDLDFAQHLARRAAVAVDNARLYREVQGRARAALVVEHVADGVVLVDRGDVVRLWNPAAERITGLAADAVVGRHAGSVFSAWEQIAPLAKTEVAPPEMQPTEVEGRELWLSVTGVTFAEGSVFAFRDLTAEHAVERLKSDFVATVSHELRTPLAAIYGAALTLRRDDVRLGEPQRSGLLEVIANESDRLARIVNDILWASRLESGTLQTMIERCDAVGLAREVVDAAAQYAPPNVHLSFDSPDDVPAVAGDRDKIRQVLTNLVDNAVKYSPDGGTVAVRIRPLPELLCISVQDIGLGVPPAEQERIFEKFYRLDPNLTRGVGGTGLGLYISRELVRRMDGRIWVESQGARGSTFFVELPFAE